MRYLFVLISSISILGACATYGSLDSIFPRYQTMNFLKDDGIDNFQINKPVKIQGYVGTHPENRGIFSTKELAYSVNPTCFEIKPSDIQKFTLRDGEKIIVAGKVRKNSCSSEELICLTACQEYIFDIDETHIIREK